MVSTSTSNPVATHFTLYRVGRILSLICTAYAQAIMKHMLKQMLYRFAVKYETLSTFICYRVNQFKSDHLIQFKGNMNIIVSNGNGSIIEHCTTYVHCRYRTTHLHQI